MLAGRERVSRRRRCKDSYLRLTLRRVEYCERRRTYRLLAYGLSELRSYRFRFRPAHTLVQCEWTQLERPWEPMSLLLEDLFTRALRF
ncbi:hypothetical protein [Mumia zhuanghuii]|uniref:Uncharacterized protein n=1 Tax=Mumia zhuanghuii TaxID=2585211 RepID=A0A5C4LTS4_9ACTN|nr:hypothetical protein [Mumia zhuanghuii]TNC21770.1 hypothetical protein FHE65_36305 [Mumia zhuanghuii]